MHRFMNYDFSVAEIRIAMYVKPGRGAAVHHDRPFHGLALHLSPDPGEEKRYVFADGKTVSVGQNEIIYLPKGSDYTVFSKQSGNCYAINFELSEEIAFEPFSVKVKNAPAFIKEFERAAELWRDKRPAFHMQCKGTLYQILAMLQQEYRLRYMAQSTAALIAPAAEYIHHHYSKEAITIPQLAALCGISEDYFRKIFRNVYGVSPRKYINELKLSYARELIRSGMYTVTEAAELSGFSDTSYFSREFKKATGQAPKEYK